MGLKFQSSKISVQALPLGPAYTDCDPTPHGQQLLVSGCPISMQQYLSAMLITVWNTMKQNVAIHSHWWIMVTLCSLFYWMHGLLLFESGRRCFSWKMRWNDELVSLTVQSHMRRIRAFLAVPWVTMKVPSAPGGTMNIPQSPIKMGFGRREPLAVPNSRAKVSLSYCNTLVPIPKHGWLTSGLPSKFIISPI